MGLAFGIIGAVVGAIFGLISAVALVELLSNGNTLGEGFLLLIAAPVGVLTGAAGGALVTVRVVPHLRKTPPSVAARRGQKRILLGLLLGIPAAFVVVIFIAREAVKPPSDSAMLGHFERQQTTFESLVKMASADKGLARVDENWTMPANTQSVGVSRERLAAYRKLLRDAGTPRGFKALSDDAGYDFYFWLRGSAISDDVQKGFAYRTTPPPGIVQALDGVHVEPGKYMVAYRHIRGSWYLFYEFIPD
jgi:hypothetical protein